MNNNTPPEIKGKFNVSWTVVGTLKNRKYSIDSPLKITNISEYKMNKRFVSMDLGETTSKDIPLREPLIGVWKRNLDKKQNFIGWELHFVDTIEDNGRSIMTPTKIKNNKVINYESIYTESGFDSNKENILQKPVVAYFKGKKIFKKKSKLFIIFVGYFS